MAKRELLMLAQVYKTTIPVGGWYASEKLDGVRAYWDGGVTRGMLCRDVKFANVEKDARYVIPPVATGLWSRYAKAIQAPSWWLDELPKYPLDGELFAGRGKFQTLISTVKQIRPGPEWRDVKYMVFDYVPSHVIYANGEIRGTNFSKNFTDLPKPEFTGGPKEYTFRRTQEWLHGLEENEVWQLHDQVLLPRHRVAHQAVEDMMGMVKAQGGEGLMLRNPTSYWSPCRSGMLLKVKDTLDSEARVVGYTWGRETELGSKLLGKMGALVVLWSGVRFELSGFTDDERSMSDPSEGFRNPGGAVSEDVHNPSFPRGTVVTFKYRELTDKGVPKEARYLRRLTDTL